METAATLVPLLSMVLLGIVVVLVVKILIVPLRALQQQLYDLAKDKGQVIQADTAAMTRLIEVVVHLTELVNANLETGRRVEAVLADRAARRDRSSERESTSQPALSDQRSKEPA